MTAESKTASDLAAECIDAFDRDPVGPPFMPDIIAAATLDNLKTLLDNAAAIG